MTAKSKVKWGVLSTAKIGVEKVIPAMQKCTNLEITAIASRDLDHARNIANELNIPTAYGSYDALLSDDDIDAVYIPLPNHMHFEWTAQAIERGKHVLCEKPMALTSSQIKELIDLRNKRGVKVGEAFMVHTHPQWEKTIELIRDESLGQLTAIQGFFSYFKTDPDNIRNKLEYGGGAIWDIGCYPIHTARMAFGQEPARVIALTERDPVMKIDRKATVILDFPAGHCSFTVGTQTVAHQRMTFFGTKNKLEVEIPFNAPNDRACLLFLEDGSLFGKGRQKIELDICDQYTLQGMYFSDAILQDKEVPVPLEDALSNCAVIEAIFASEKQGGWVEL